jgi:hypothetical protein
MSQLEAGRKTIIMKEGSRRTLRTPKLTARQGTEAENNDQGSHRDIAVPCIARLRVLHVRVSCDRRLDGMQPATIQRLIRTGKFQHSQEKEIHQEAPQLQTRTHAKSSHSGTHF